MLILGPVALQIFTFFSPGYLRKYWRIRFNFSGIFRFSFSIFSSHYHATMQCCITYKDEIVWSIMRGNLTLRILAGSYKKGDSIPFLTTQENVLSCICEIKIAS